LRSQGPDRRPLAESELRGKTDREKNKNERRCTTHSARARTMRISVTGGQGSKSPDRKRMGETTGSAGAFCTRTDNKTRHEGGGISRRWAGAKKKAPLIIQDRIPEK